MKKTSTLLLVRHSLSTRRSPATAGRRLVGEGGSALARHSRGEGGSLNPRTLVTLLICAVRQGRSTSIARGRHESNGLVNRFEIRIGSFPDALGRQGIDGIEGSHFNPEIVCLGAKRTDTARYIQHSFPDQLVRLEEEIPPILVKRATQQHDAIKLQPACCLDRAVAHPRVRGV